MEKDNFQDKDVDARMVLKWILKMRMGGCELDSSGSG
jgi:hypothetical protein